MRNFSEHAAQNEKQPRMMPFWLFFVLYTVSILVLTHLATAVVFSSERSYSSPAQSAGLPLLSFGSTAKGIIAIGGKATGILAIGGLAVGMVAVGEAALGGLAVGKYASAGNGVAYGSMEAGGRQKEHLLG